MLTLLLEGVGKGSAATTGCMWLAPNTELTCGLLPLPVADRHHQPKQQVQQQCNTAHSTALFVFAAEAGRGVALSV